jgi:hypothetical protein
VVPSSYSSHSSDTSLIGFNAHLRGEPFSVIRQRVGTLRAQTQTRDRQKYVRPLPETYPIVCVLCPNFRIPP